MLFHARVSDRVQGQWDLSFGPVVVEEEPFPPLEATIPVVLVNQRDGLMQFCGCKSDGVTIACETQFK